MNDVKPFWASVTFWGAIATFLGILAPGFGWKVTPTDINNILSSAQQAIDSVLTFGGLFLAIWGRFRATKQISMSGK